MRAFVPAGIFCLFFTACSSGGDGDPDAGLVGMDADAPDASTGDSGRFPTPCGNVTCTEDQYCQIDPTGACVASMNSSCAAQEESCNTGGDAGCTTPRDRECRAIPAQCAPNPQCACMINQNLCPAAVLTMCRRPVGQGVTIECPFQ